MRVAVLDDIHDAYETTAGIRRLRERAEVVIFRKPITSPAELAGFDALIASRERTRFTRTLLEQLPDLRIIAQTGNHIYHLDLAAAKERGIVVGRTTTGGCTSAAELAIALMMAVMRQIPQSEAAIRRDQWLTPMTRSMRGKTLGLIGLGLVGRHVAKIANAFGMKVIAWSPSLTRDTAASAGVEACDLDALMEQSDIVSVHATLAPTSRGLVDARRIGLMKRTAYLVNTARGPIVDEPALVEALRTGRIAGAGLDVFDEEPLPPQHPFKDLQNVVLTSHLGWVTDEMYERFAEAAADVLIAYLDGRDFRRWDEGH